MTMLIVGFGVCGTLFMVALVQHYPGSGQY
jgi:hypothetical protein